MGKQKKHRKKAKEQKLFDEIEEKLNKNPWKTVKDLSKQSKKRKSKKKKEKDDYSTNEKELRISHWHQVLVNVNSEVEKMFLLSSIGNYVDTPFCPLGYHKRDDDISFYFERDQEVADAIESLDKRIQSVDGKTMSIEVKLVENPDLVLNANQLETLKEVILSRYNPELNLLDLTCLFYDQVLVDKDIFVPMNSPLIMKQVLRIIRDNIKNLGALNLSKNKLDNSGLKLIQGLNSPTLKALNLESNNLSSLQFIKFIQVFPLEELKIASNRIEKHLKENNSKMIMSIKNLIPTLTMLDGIPMTNYGNAFRSPIIKPNTLPTSSGLSQQVTEEKIKTFLEHYFIAFDVPGRANLIPAYLESSKVELKSENPLIPSVLFESLSDIQQFLSSFPETKHVFSSFKLNIYDITSDEGFAQVSGLCHIKGLEESVTFQRTMKIIANNAGLCCSLDAFQIK